MGTGVVAALSGKLIRERLRAPLVSRLVVRPLLEPAEQLKADQASVDLRLGCQFALIAPSALGAIDEFGPEWESLDEAMFERLYDRRYVPIGEKITLHPHQFVLAETLEYLRLPPDLMAYVVGRSTWGRLGLIVATAIGVHPRFAGCLTLELRNLGELPISLYPGQSIAQLFIHTVDGTNESSEGLGQYTGSVDLIPKKMSSALTHHRIRALIDKRLESQD